ncbi:MAG: glycosyltransferase family 4 protein [Planctomycetota bacterium]|nr:glycosyltransferase [Planctomycetaceae bacterium]MDQ3332089.1 glycosyltransferase family 4 protein [Planctomycetota bacterium]
MKSLIINTSDDGGGAAIAAMNLHRALLTAGVDSQVMVGAKSTSDARLHLMPGGRRIVDRAASRIARRVGLNDVGTTSSFRLETQQAFRSADVVNLHNLHGGYFNYLSVPAIARRKPVVLTLHDMWSFTGHCVYSFDCERWRTGCGRCPYPDTYPAVRRDATRWEWKLKRRSFVRPSIRVVAISRWMEEQIGRSFLGELPVHHIPNGIDTELYRPLDREQCRNALNLDRDALVVAFFAADLSDPRKGFDLLSASLNRLPETLRREVIVLTVGGGGVSGDLPVHVRSLGFVADASQKALAYSAADVLALPSRIDNLPVVLQESFACGTPAVAFDVGGVADLVRPGETGSLAPPGDVNAFADELAALLADRTRLAKYREWCRRVATDEYSLPVQGRRYREVFEEALRDFHEKNQAQVPVRTSR